jgi:hypothetical protein
MHDRLCLPSYMGPSVKRNGFFDHGWSLPASRILGHLVQDKLAALLGRQFLSRSTTAFESKVTETPCYGGRPVIINVVL